MLGEHVKDLNEVESVTKTYLKLLDEINLSSLKSNISVKPTHIGLDLSLDTFHSNALRLVKSAKEKNNFIRFDMENSSTTDSTINVFKEIHKDYKMLVQFFKHIEKTYTDIEKLQNQINFRLCKGIYNEDAGIAYKSYDEINSNYLKIAEMAFKNGCYIIEQPFLHLTQNLYNLIKSIAYLKKI